MGLGRIEAELASTAGAVLVDPRLLRRVIKQHRGVSGLVPHGRCYFLTKKELLALVQVAEIAALAEVGDEVVLLARPPPRQLERRSEPEVVTYLWRAVFHARIHRALERRIADGALGDAEVRRRIDMIGQTEFDEVRSILRHDDMVLPPYDDREVYVEFAALYLELRYFAPNLLVTTFPGLGSHERVAEALALDIDDPKAIVERGRPRQVAGPAHTTRLAPSSSPSFSAPAGFGFVDRSERPRVSRAKSLSLLSKAAAARKVGNDVRAALLAARAATTEDNDASKQADRAAREALGALSQRLSRALAAKDADGGAEGASFGALGYLLADRAADQRWLGFGPEARLLHALERAALAHERGERAVDLAGWILSRGRRKIVRPLPATRELNVVRHIQAADKRVRNVRLSSADRKLVAKLLAWARQRADANVRAALRPTLHEVISRVGVRADTDPERLAKDKLVEELLDHAIANGYISFPALRDAISRNQLKLDDLEGPRELMKGDALLKADALLSDELDGIYKKSDVYLRVLQRMSSVPFGTKAGRAVTLFLVLPVGAAYIVLEGAHHLATPVLGWFGAAPFETLGFASFSITAAFFFALIHSAPFRAFSMQALEILGLVLATVFLRLPRAFFALPVVRRLLARPAVRVALRRVVAPLLVALVVYWLAPFRMRDFWLGVVAFLATFLVASGVMGTPVGAWIEDFLVDQIAPTWKVLSRQWLPGLFRMVSRFFAALMDLLSRAIFRVDELLRFREGQGAIAAGVKGMLGLFWAMVAYVLRLYMTLLVEPEINPLKHFPVVTVAHKLMLPFTPGLLGVLEAPLAPFGAVVAGAVAGVTVFLLPSAFGFLAWELKENYKLYRATRPDGLGVARLGPHGETMRGLLVVGLHSGTLPKLYERLRRAAQRQDEALAAAALVGSRGLAPSDAGLGQFREGVRLVALGIERFVERELGELLKRTKRWRHGAIDVLAVDLSSNRVRVRIRCAAIDAEPCQLTFEEQSGYIVAGMVEPGFVARLPRADSDGALLLENALAGLYQRAEVDVVREQLEAALGEGVQYDIADDGLLVWPGSDFKTELVYRIGRRPRRARPPVVRGEKPERPPPVLEPRAVLFPAQSIGWHAWVAAWAAADHHEGVIPRLMQGAPLLPPAAGIEVPRDATGARASTALGPKGTVVIPEPAVAGGRGDTVTIPESRPDDDQQTERLR